LTKSDTKIFIQQNFFTKYETFVLSLILYILDTIMPHAEQYFRLKFFSAINSDIFD